ncbi:MAG TPA: hypothetical protein VG479_12225 [Gaiellaceae bacterium]|jgi:hypothetical protein|nr:hypothetical protein [Gaiellaceae bacterium]
MPKGRVQFNTGSPKHPDWPAKPERVLAELARRHNAAYVPRSFHKSQNGKVGWALIDTVEPEPDSRATSFYGLGTDLDADSITLYIGGERWLELLGLPPEEPGDEGA